jgi:hypothetical protein
VFRSAVGLYCVSFFLPVFGILVSNPPYYGYEVFWAYRFSPFDWWVLNQGAMVGQLMWLANPAMWVGVVFWQRGLPGRALVCGILGFWFAFPVLLLLGGDVLLVLIRYPGYWVWLSSFVWLAVAGWKACRRPTDLTDEDWPTC